MLHHDADQVRAAVSPADAVTLLGDALRAGLDPAADPPRTSSPLGSGELLTMPASSGRCAGVKLAVVAPGNAARGLARIQGLYVLFDADTLAPLATVDGPALTGLRTAATSVAAVLPALRRGGAAAGPLSAVVVGGGVQGRAHAEVLADVLGQPGERGLARVDVLVRRPEALAPSDVLPPGVLGSVLGLGTAPAVSALARADAVFCATSAAAPLFDSALLRDDVVVAAVGSHERDRRELDDALLRRATVVVEDRTTALREAGDVVMAIEAGALVEDDLVTMSDLLTGRCPVPEGAVVFKGTGMAWQDLVVAEAVHRRAATSLPVPGEARLVAR
ncbi:ornithine cyclodeaminase [Quadrisphaera granulorum]|uniref:Ornithine cyclodeaminase n=1 Tax=Quadrisphaera granulorum TaxID=317664 RepID=A0A315ZVM7_9ACTN|nr:ornithine cyclodeaminase family protein [Quadrisphaera granulorum]PWJ49565.1 ornithine cyclodeaminase [Quadrisphaera granulorum]SZE98144.1 ornithine cyclodeaminase [Quadrisphaera granulorum]